MRTKTFLLSAAVLAAGLTISTAQSVYSVNAVGYVNVTVGNGYNLIANPLNGTNNNINTIIPTAPDGSVVLKWDTAAQGFAAADSYVGGLGWVDGAFNPSVTTIKPGEGFFFQNPGASATLTFVGEVPQGSLTNQIAQNYGFYSSIVPQSAGLTTIGFPGQDGMNYFTWNAANQAYDQALSYVNGLGWVDGAFNTVDPTPLVAQGFLINNPGAAVAWTRTFSVN